MATTFVNHGGAPHGIQFSPSSKGIEEIVLAGPWRDFCEKLAFAMKALAIANPQPDDHSLAMGDPDRGTPPPGDYKAHYQAFAEQYGDHYHAVLANTKRNAIWVETGTHPGGNPDNYVVGRHVMAQAMEQAFNFVRGV